MMQLLLAMYLLLWLLLLWLLLFYYWLLWLFIRVVGVVNLVHLRGGGSWRVLRQVALLLDWGSCWRSLVGVRIVLPRVLLLLILLVLVRSANLALSKMTISYAGYIHIYVALYSAFP